MSYLALKGVSELVQLGKSSCSAYENLREKREMTYEKTRYFGQ